MRKMLNKLMRFNGPAWDSVLLALIQVISYVTALLTTKILSMQLSLTEYGTYSTVNTVIEIAAAMTLFGLGDSINYYYNNQNSLVKAEERIEFVNTIFFVQLCVGLTVGVILFFCSGMISGYYNNPTVKPLLMIVCLKPWISNATHLYQVLFVSTGKAKIIALRNLIISVSKSLLVLFAVLIFESISLIFLSLFLLDVIQFVVFRYIFGKTGFKIKIASFRKEKIFPIIKYTIPIGIYFVSVTLMREIDKLVIGRMGSTEDLAVYANCAKALPVNILITSFSTVLVPYIMKSVSGRNYPLTVKILKQYLTVGYLSVWMFSGALLLCAPEAIRFLYSAEYLKGLPIFIIYLIDGMVMFASVHLVIAANGETKYLMKTSILMLVINAVASVLMYHIFALMGVPMLGPAITTLVVSIGYVYVVYLRVATILNVKIRDFVPLKKMVWYVCELLALGLVFGLVKNYFHWLQIPWFLSMLLICGCYCVTVMLLHLKEYRQLFAEINYLKRLME